MSTPTDGGIPAIFKSHFGSIFSGIGTIVLALVVGFGNYKSHDTHQTDEVQQLQVDVSQLKQQVANDLATRREVDGVKEDVKEVKGMLLEELKFHRLRP